MPPKIYHFTCKHCNKARQTFDDKMVFCSTDCEHKFNYYAEFSKTHATVSRQKSLLKRNTLHKCYSCGKETSNKRFCSAPCSRSFYNSERVKKIEKKRKEEPVKERKKPKYSFEKLNKMSEWKRVFDDESWTNRFGTWRG